MKNLKKIIILVVALLTNKLILAQSNTLSWLNTLSADTSVTYSGVKTDVNGYIYAFGSVRDSVDIDPGPGVFMLNSAALQNGEAFFAKYTPSGALVWAKKLDVTLTVGNEFSGISEFDISADGFLAVAGAYNGVVDMDPGAGNSSLSSTKQNAFIAKYDTTGAYIWAKRLVSGTNAGDLVSIYRVSFNSLGDIIYSGQLYGTTDFNPGAGTFNLTSAGSTGDVHVSKIDGTGTWQWTVKYGSTSIAYVRDILVNSTGDIYLAGNFKNTLDFDPGSGTVNRTSVSSSDDMYLLKLNTNGIYSWVINLGSTGTDMIESMCFDANENIAFGGRFEGTVDMDYSGGTAMHTVTGNPTYRDIVMAKYSPAGVYINSFSIGGPNVEDIKQIEYMNGKYYVGASYYYSILLDPGIGNVNYTAQYRGDFVAVYDEFGQYNTSIVFDTIAPYPNQTYARASMAIDPSGSFILCGQNKGVTEFNPQGSSVLITSASNNYWDGFLSKYNYNPCTTLHSSISATICSGTTYNFNGNAISSAGIHTDTLTAVNGCDSVVTLNLTVNPTYNLSEAISICNGSSYTLPNGSSVSTAGTYTSNLTTMNGCDSIIVSTVTVNPAYNLSESVSICNGSSYTLPNGSSVSTAGTYTSNLTTMNGCDSIIVSTVNVTVPIVSTTVSGGITIVADAAGVMYQWIDCNNGNAIITGETSQAYSPVMNGDYAVIINDNSCVDTSACVNISSIGIESISSFNTIEVYPNPATNVVNIKSGLEQTELILINALGETILKTTIQKGTTELPINTMESGVYQLIFVSGKSTQVSKLIITK